MTEGCFSEVTPDFIQEIMDLKRLELEKIKREWDALYEARRIYLAAERKHHEFDKKKDLEEAMARNFNPFDTFSLKKKK
jgi:hypothetical protein